KQAVSSAQLPGQPGLTPQTIYKRPPCQDLHLGSRFVQKGCGLERALARTHHCHLSTCQMGKVAVPKRGRVPFFRHPDWFEHRRDVRKCIEPSGDHHTLNIDALMIVQDQSEMPAGVLNADNPPLLDIRYALLLKPASVGYKVLQRDRQGNLPTAG